MVMVLYQMGWATQIIGHLYTNDYPTAQYAGTGPWLLELCAYLVSLLHLNQFRVFDGCSLISDHSVI